jgi:hypothetical protein
MKRLIILLILLTGVKLSGFGQSVKSVTDIPKLKIEILSGNPKYFKNAKNYFLQFDYSDLKIGGYNDEQAYIDYMKEDAELRKKGSSDAWLKKWKSDRTEFFQPKFLEVFNSYSGNKIIADTVLNNQQYTLKLHTQFIEIGFNRNFKKSPTYINIVASISDLEGTEQPLIISIENVVGNEVFSSYSPDFRRIEEAYAKCAKELAKYMNKVIY